MATEFDDMLRKLHRLEVRAKGFYDGWEASIWLGNSMIGVARDVEGANNLLEPVRTEIHRRTEIDRLRRALGQPPLGGCLFQEGEYAYKCDRSIHNGAYPHIVLQGGAIPQLAFFDNIQIDGQNVSGEVIATFAAGAFNGRDEAERMRRELIDQEQQNRSDSE